MDKLFSGVALLKDLLNRGKSPMDILGCLFLFSVKDKASLLRVSNARDALYEIFKIKINESVLISVIDKLAASGHINKNEVEGTFIVRDCCEVKAV